MRRNVSTLAQIKTVAKTISCHCTIRCHIVKKECQFYLSVSLVTLYILLIVWNFGPEYSFVTFYMEKWEVLNAQVEWMPCVKALMRLLQLQSTQLLLKEQLTNYSFSDLGFNQNISQKWSESVPLMKKMNGICCQW